MPTRNSSLARLPLSAGQQSFASCTLAYYTAESFSWCTRRKPLFSHVAAHSHSHSHSRCETEVISRKRDRTGPEPEKPEWNGSREKTGTERKRNDRVSCLGILSQCCPPAVMGCTSAVSTRHLEKAAGCSLGRQMYWRKAALCHLCSICIIESSTPAMAADVAELLRKLCPAYSFQGRQIEDRAARIC